MFTTEQMIMEEAREYMQPAAEIRASQPVSTPQQRIILAETGIRHPGNQITNRRELEAFCHRLNDSECFEKFSIIAVNTKCNIIGVYSIQGSLSEVNAYPRVVVTYALLANAYGVFFTHNHPGGTCAPSTEDIRSTAQIKKILSQLDIHVLDHMITTPDGNGYSMAQHGDISN